MIPELRARLLENPFYVLELAPDCSRADIERAGQKLLAMLELGLSGADRYATPLGDGRRDTAKVREAMAELRDPQRRLLHELWVARPTGSEAISSDAHLDDEVLPSFPNAPSTLGWRR